MAVSHFKLRERTPTVVCQEVIRSLVGVVLMAARYVSISEFHTWDPSGSHLFHQLGCWCVNSREKIGEGIATDSCIAVLQHDLQAADEVLTAPVPAWVKVSQTSLRGEMSQASCSIVFLDPIVRPEFAGCTVHTANFTTPPILGLPRMDVVLGIAQVVCCQPWPPTLKDMD